MEITVYGKNVQVTDGTREYAKKKLVRLSKYFSELKEAKVYHSVQKNQHRIEVQLEGDGVTLRGEERADSLHACIDLVAEKLEQRVKKFKGKLHSRSLDKGPKEKQAMKAKIAYEAQAPETIDSGEPFQPVIERTKRFPVKPMDPDEAIESMELLHHDFFVFVNADTSQVSVVYRRKDGNYGLLEPDL